MPRERSGRRKGMQSHSETAATACTGAVSKYVTHGAYHWKQAMSGFRARLPYLSANYEVLIDVVREELRPAGEFLEIVEIGCGDGVALAHLRDLQRPTLVGVDSDALALELCAHEFLRRGWRPPLLLNGDATRLPLADSIADIVVSLEVIEHIENAWDYLSEVRRIPKKNGAFILTTPVRDPNNGLRSVHHVREDDAEELRQLLRGMFRHVEMYAYRPVWAQKLYDNTGRFGRGLMKALSAAGWNPFCIRRRLADGSAGGGYEQMIAVAREPVEE